MKTSNFYLFSGGAWPRGPDPLKFLQSVQPFRIRRDCPDFTGEPRIRLKFSWDTSIPILKIVSHKPMSREI